MARTNQQSNKGNPRTFVGGMVSDVDPRYQPENSYREAFNLRLISLENIDGNILTVDLANTFSGSSHSTETGHIVNNIDGSLFDHTASNPHPLYDLYGTDTAGSQIVGYYSYQNTLILIVISKDPYYASANPATNAADLHKVFFFKVTFNPNTYKVEEVRDLMVCYEYLNNKWPGFGDLNMLNELPLRIEGLVENGCITRIYWTDNQNPLRSINISSKDLHLLSPDELSIVPRAEMTQPILADLITGSLPVGVYQYCFKYVNENGTETGMSPLSNLVQTANHLQSTSITYQGSPPGEITSQGVRLELNNLDTDYEYVELYSLFWEDLDTPPRVAVVDKKYISANSTLSMYHTIWQNELEDGLNAVLIQTNTWDVCKDIAIKDNILFAANLRSRQNIVDESEWNVRVMRWVLNDIEDSVPAWGKGSLTSTDSSVVMYQNKNEIANTLFTNNSYTEYEKLNADCNNHATAHRYLATKNDDFPVLGAESYQYGETGVNEGCRVTFRVGRKEGDVLDNRDESPFVEVSSSIEDFKLDCGEGGANIPNNTGANTYSATMSFSANKDPQCAGSLRGYQRGETYRFGVLVFDKTGNPGNVLWIGDIQTPQHYDLCRQIDRDWHVPGFPTRDMDNTKFIHNGRTQDFRLDSVEGYMVPCIQNFEAGYWSTNMGSKARVLGVEDAFDPQKPFPRWDLTSSGVNKKGYPVLDNSTTPGTMTYDNARSQKHEVHDLFIDFEFLIPEEVEKKISGFQVVRAERDEINKSVLATGLLNQTAKYGFQGDGAGSASTRLAGYVPRMKDWIDEEDNTDIIVNQSWTNSSDLSQANVFPAVPEYDQKLNGFIGLQEHNTAYGYNNSNLAANLTPTDDNACGQSSINTNPGIGNSGSTATAGTEQAPQKNIYVNTEGDGGTGGESAASQYFGSYEHSLQHRMWMTSTDCTTVDFTVNGVIYDTPTPNSGQNNHQFNYFYSAAERYMNEDYDTGGVKHQVWTFDSPDSAFGLRGYVFSSSHKLRVISTLKLTRNDKHSHNSLPNFQDITGGTQGLNPHPSYFWLPRKLNDVIKAATGYNDTNGIGDNNAARELCSRFETNDSNHHGYLVGKWYTLDTSFYHQCNDMYGGNNNYGVHSTNHAYLGDGASNTLTATAAQYIVNASPWMITALSGTIAVQRGTGYMPGNDIAPIIRDINYNNVPLKYGFGHKYVNQIMNAKEIADGEIVPSSFFKNIKYKGRGFSNHTLGFVKYGAAVNPHISSGEQTNYTLNENLVTQEHNHFGFGKMHRHIANYNSAHGVTGAPTNSNLDDLRYETISSMQKGLRSILIELQFPLFVRNVAQIAFEKNMFDNNTEWYGGSLDSSGYSNDNLKNDRNMLMPYKLLGQIVRDITNQYGGDDKFSLEATTYMPCGPFQRVVTNNQRYFNTVTGGDTFVNLYSHQKTSNPNPKFGYSRFQLFPVESYVNTDMRSGPNLINGDVIEGTDPNTLPNQNAWLYNGVYSQQANLKHYLPVRSSQCKFIDLPYEIAYSKTKVSGEIKDSFKSFPMFNFHDVEGSYGAINRIFNYQDEIYVLQDNAFCKLLVNPRTLIQTETGTEIYTGTGDTIENHQYITTKYGSRHRFSVVFSDTSVYFVDVNRDAIVKFGSEGLDVISETKGIKNLIRDIISNSEGNLKSYKKVTLPDYAIELPATGVVGTNSDLTDKWNDSDYIRNTWNDYIFRQLGIHGAYDQKNKEVIFTFLDKTLDSSKVGLSEPVTNTWVYTFYPCLWIHHMGRLFNPKKRIYMDDAVFYDYFIPSGNDDVNNSNLSGIGTSFSKKTNITGGNFLIDIDQLGIDPPYENLNHEDLSNGALQLWQWDFPSVAPGFMFGHLKDDGSNLTVYHTLRMIINDFPTENKKFDNFQMSISPGTFDNSVDGEPIFNFANVFKILSAFGSAL